MNEETPTEQENKNVGEARLEVLHAEKRYQETVGGDQTSFAAMMLEEKSIPEAIKQLMPVFADKEFALSNLNNEYDLDLFKLLFEDAVTDYHLYTPHFKQDPETEKLIGMLRTKFLIKLYRSTGGHDRERAQYQTVTSVQERTPVKTSSGGIFAKFKEKLI